MNIDERIYYLEEKEREVSQKISRIESLQSDRWVTPKELASIMNCSINNIYIKIRSGDIYATNKLGAAIRIPMSQFYQTDKALTTTPTVKVKSKEKSIKEIVFG